MFIHIACERFSFFFCFVVTGTAEFHLFELRVKTFVLLVVTLSLLVSVNKNVRERTVVGLVDGYGK